LLLLQPRYTFLVQGAQVKVAEAAATAAAAAAARTTTCNDTAAACNSLAWG
jgi:hypothetical protein